MHSGSPISKSDLIGRTAIRFKESMTEAKADANGRMGPMPLHTEANKFDRVRRGMQIA
jgi:hypothetical protein